MATVPAYPFTLQNNTTADATQVMADFNNIRNAVVNNAAGSGVNTDITALLGLTTPLAPGFGGSSVFIGGTSTGSANAQVVGSTTPTGFSLTNGYRVTFTVGLGLTNTTVATLNVNAQGATAINRVGHSGLEPLTGGEMVAGNVIEAIYNGSVFVLLSTDLSAIGQAISIVGAATTDLGTVPTHNALITGSGATITAFGSSASATDPIYLIAFSGVQTLTYNATSLLIPGSANITTAANDTAVVEYLGSGNWQVLSYSRANGASVAGSASPGSVNGLVITNGGTPNTTVTVTFNAAAMISTAGVPIFAGSSTLTLNLTVVGANGLDAGSLANSTFYHIYAISNGSTTAGLASTSATAPTMPAGYVYKKRLGAMVTDSSANLMRTRQVGDVAEYVITPATNTASLPLIASGTTVSAWTAESLAAFVPSTALAAEVTLRADTGTLAAAAPNTNYTTSISNPVAPLFLNVEGGANARAITGFITLQSGSIFYLSNSASAGNGILSVGWRDNLSY